MQNSNTSFIKSVASQVTAIIIAALGAAAIAFLQSLAAQTGACSVPAADPSQAGVIGAMLKSAHSALTMNRGIV